MLLSSKTCEAKTSMGKGPLWHMKLVDSLPSETSLPTDTSLPIENSEISDHQSNLEGKIKS